jgi:hypothetical protein
MACTANTPLEKALEADILTLRKRGHFYFALTEANISPDALGRSAGVNLFCLQRVVLASRPWFLFA